MKFSTEYQPEGRGRPPGALNRINKLIRSAAPDVIATLIDKAKRGDIAAAHLILARAVPPLRAASAPIHLRGKPETPAEFVRELIGAASRGADPIAVAQIVKAIRDAVDVMEFEELETRVESLERAHEN